MTFSSVETVGCGSKVVTVASGASGSPVWPPAAVKSIVSFRISSSEGIMPLLFMLKRSQGSCQRRRYHRQPLTERLDAQGTVAAGCRSGRWRLRRLQTHGPEFPFWFSYRVILPGISIMDPWDVDRILLIASPFNPLATICE